MTQEDAQSLRNAIENLVNAKLYDAMARPGGIQRLIAHRCSGVASLDIRNAQRRLEQVLEHLAATDPPAGRAPARKCAASAS